MGYAVITEDGRYEPREGTPTIEALAEILGADPEINHTTDRSVVFWTAADAMARSDRGELRRNVVGTVLAVMTGGDAVPYAGPMVFTGRRIEADGYSPGPLTLMSELATESAVNDIRYVLYGEGRPDDPEILLPIIIEHMRDVAAMAEGPWRDTPLVLRSLTLDEATAMLTGAQSWPSGS